MNQKNLINSYIPQILKQIKLFYEYEKIFTRLFSCICTCFCICSICICYPLERHERQSKYYYYDSKLMRWQ